MKNNKNLIPKKGNDEKDYNLGLDADHSSDGDTPEARWNDDNDRISGNPEGESDDSDNNTALINSPLDDK